MKIKISMNVYKDQYECRLCIYPQLNKKQFYCTQIFIRELMS